MIFRVGAERSRRRSVHKVHDCGENREGNNPENSAVKGITIETVCLISFYAWDSGRR
ncbi:MAG: hypothetical protein U1E78_11005 [Gammaproteobacteria bacterium]